MVSRPSTQEHLTLPSRNDAPQRTAARTATATESATRLLPEDSDLAAVIEAWDRLLEAIRAGIVAMVKTASGNGGSG
jgi:hypothetical protein